MGKVFRNKKVKSPYFMSVAQNSHLTNKPEADGGAHFTPLPPLHQCSVLRVFKAKKEVKKRNGGHT